MSAGLIATWYRWRPDAQWLTLELAIQPGAKHNAWMGLHGNALKLRVHAPPIDGRANRALIEFIANEFDTPKAQVTVIRGESSRIKTVRIDSPRTIPDPLRTLGLTLD